MRGEALVGAKLSGIENTEPSRNPRHPFNQTTAEAKTALDAKYAHRSKSGNERCRSGSFIPIHKIGSRNALGLRLRSKN
jgi:hypothetical protein